MYVLDSSAVIALLNREPGADFVKGVLRDSVLSTVNLQEIVKKLLERGHGIEKSRQLVADMQIELRVHDEADAFLAASLATATRAYGSGLGDRSCMALAIRLGVPALTTDRVWERLEIPGLIVQLAR